MTYEQIRSDLKNKIYRPIYFLMGDEPYYIDAIVQEIEENLLTEAERGFNQTVVYGRDVNLDDVVAMARRFPMMANYQVIIVKEAQDLFKATDLQKLQDVIKAREVLASERNTQWMEEIKQKSLKTFADAVKQLSLTKASDKKALEEVFESMQFLSTDTIKKYNGLINLLDNPVKSTILVFAYKYAKLDRRKTFTKKLETAGVLFESSKLYDYKVPDWIMAYMKDKGYSIDLSAATLLAEYLGTDLTRIVNEMLKLIINIPAGSKINNDHIEKYIGISKAYNIFELQKALGSNDAVKATQIANFFASNEKDNPVVKTLAVLFSFFSKLMLLHSLKDRSPNAIASALSINPYFVKDYQQAAQKYTEERLENVIQLLQEYDLKSKGVGNVSISDGELTRELVYRIMH